MSIGNTEGRIVLQEAFGVDRDDTEAFVVRSDSTSGTGNTVFKVDTVNEVVSFPGTNSIEYGDPYTITVGDGTDMLSLTPSTTTFKIDYDQDAQTEIVVQNESSGTSAMSRFRAFGGGGDNFVAGVFGQSWTPLGDADQPGTSFVSTSGAGNSINISTAADTSAPIRFYTSGIDAGNLAMTLAADQGVLMPGLKSGATQVAAGAAAGELWITSSHATQEDNTVMIGV